VTEVQRIGLDWIGCSGATKARVCRRTGRLGQSMDSGVSGRRGETVHALVVAALKPVHASAIVQGSAVLTITYIFYLCQIKT